ncbi:MAG: HEAT repeat domain-containing protein [FCB group bacterium]|nr:HEAT repeat domain-containing protein [FCB group bacterium]
METIAANQDVEKFKGIVAKLKDDDSDERRWAVYDLEEFKPADTINYLIEAVQDENRAVREAASEVLQGLPPEVCTKSLTPLLGSDRIEVRNSVAMILVTYGDAAVNELLPALTSENEDVRKFAADILGLAGSEKAVDMLCKTSLSDPVENVRSSAVEALGKIASSKALLTLYELLNLPEGPRAEAAEAIGRIGHSDSKPFLEDRLGTKDPLFAYAVVEALGKIGDKTSLDLLYQMLDDSPELLKNEILTSILQIAGREELSVFGDIYPQLIELTLNRLAESGSDFAELVSNQLSMVPPVEVIKRFYERSWEMPSNLLVKLIEISKTEALLEKEVCKLTDHSDDWVAYTAVENLIGFKSSITQKTILSVLEKGEGMRVLAAVKVAAALKLSEALGILKKLTTSQNPDIKSASTRAVAELSELVSNE